MYEGILTFTLSCQYLVMIQHVICRFSTLISRSNVTTDTNYFIITISQTVIRLYYHPQESSAALRSVDTGVLDLDLSAFWNHVTITVYLEDVTYYINGSVVGTSTLDSPIADGPSLIYLGEVTPGM